MALACCQLPSPLCRQPCGRQTALAMTVSLLDSCARTAPVRGTVLQSESLGIIGVKQRRRSSARPKSSNGYGSAASSRTSSNKPCTEGGARLDVISGTVGFVDVHVDADHEVDGLERGFAAGHLFLASHASCAPRVQHVLVLPGVRLRNNHYPITRLLFTMPVGAAYDRRGFRWYLRPIRLVVHNRGAKELFETAATETLAARGDRTGSNGPLELLKGDRDDRR